MNFSQRMGLKPAKPILQLDSISEDLRNLLWNVLLNELHTEEYYTGKTARSLWEDFFKKPIDELPDYGQTSTWQIKMLFFDLDWNEVYDLFEFLCSQSRSSACHKRLSEAINPILAQEGSGYNMVGGRFIPITDRTELEAMSDALEASEASRYSNVHSHLDSAIQHLSQKPTPDFRNSIKESISAVESICKMLSSEDSGGIDKAIEKLAYNIGMHGAMKEAFKKLYAYTSDEDGIRHAMLDEPNVGLAEAKYMLVTCSAFVYFVIMKLPLEQAH